MSELGQMFITHFMFKITIIKVNKAEKNNEGINPE